MKRGGKYIAKLILPILLILSACREESISETVIPFASLTSTVTVTAVSSITPTPYSASLSGNVFLVWLGVEGGKPFGFSIELRQANNSELIAKSDEDILPSFNFEGLTPGVYELWVLIPSYARSISNCYDIGLPDDRWKLGKLDGNGQRSFLEGISYKDALFQSVNDTNTESGADDFYAVFDNLEVTPLAEHVFQVNLICVPYQ